MARVLVAGLCAVPAPRRAGVQLRHVIRSLSAHHEVDVLVVREADQPHVERRDSVQILRVPSPELIPSARIDAFRRALHRQLDGAEYDVVHCRDAWSGLAALEARGCSGFAVIYDLSRSPLGDPDLDAQYARDERACLAAADVVLVPTPAALEALDGGARGRARLSPLGVDIDRFDWDEPPNAGPPCVLFVGELDAARGALVLVRAMAAVVREFDARLVLAGPLAASFDRDLRRAIEELGLAGAVERIGAIEHDRVPELIASATLCVVPAADSPVCPTKLLEYLACRRAVVAPRRDVVARVVADDREALLFDPGDPSDLSRKILRLLEAPLLRDRLAHGGYERVRREFTASAARRAVRAVYDEL